MLSGEDGVQRPALDSAFDSRAGRALDLKYVRALRDAFVSAECAGNILVVHTVSGMAMAAAAAIDSLDWPEVLGCIGGDDTVMAAVRTPEAAPEIIERLNAIAAL
ncbi:MAG: hypothetical protein Q4A32_08075 [Lachnospiraceae bacterium]|nr:hypothetical protein [Lachnospiraceae bacterium]